MPAEARDPRRYARLKLIVSLLDSALGLAAGLLLVLTPASRLLAEWVTDAVGPGNGAWLAYHGMLAGAFFLLGLPSGFVSGYVVEHRYGLSNQSVAGWLLEAGKGVALAAALGAPIVLGFRQILLLSGEYWALISAVGVFVLMVLLVRLAPVLLLPIFFKFKPVDDAALVDSLRDVCENGGLSLEGVYQFDMSKTTRKANAAFTGLGKTKRIILGDTLLAAFPPDEIRAVVAHEVGHFHHAHLLKGLGFNAVLVAGLFLAAQALYQAWAPALGYGPAGDLAGLPLIYLLLGLAGFFFQPVSNGLSRHFERQADRYAFAHGDPRPMASALRRLASQNLAELEPNRVVEFLFHSHPAVAERIAAAERQVT